MYSRKYLRKKDVVMDCFSENCPCFYWSPPKQITSCYRYGDLESVQVSGISPIFVVSYPCDARKPDRYAACCVGRGLAEFSSSYLPYWGTLWGVSEGGGGVEGVRE